MTDWPYPFWFAHRGAGKLAPENTLAAFRAGLAFGHRAFECDLNLSADGEPFLLHDAELVRTTGAPGVASDLPWAALSRLDAGSWHSLPFAGEPLPHLDTIARFCQRNGCALNIEIKPTAGRETVTGRAVAAAAQRLWAHATPRPLLSSFSVDALAAAAQAAPDLTRALLLDTLGPGWLDTAQALGCAAVVFNHRLLDAATIGSMQANRLRALAFTVNDADRAAELVGAGIDGLITDAVDRLGPHDPRPAG